MKTLYLLRHAKATGSTEGITDFERPLTIRGRVDAASLAKTMQDKNLSPSMIVSSPATRANFTARIVAEGIQYPTRFVQVDERIYEAWIEQLLEVIAEIDNVHPSAMLVGHNPGFQMLATHISDFKEDKFPTCSFLVIEFQVDNWQDITPKSGVVTFFDYPKK